MNISKFTTKFILASLVFSVVQGPVLAINENTKVNPNRLVIRDGSGKLVTNPTTSAVQASAPAKQPTNDATNGQTPVKKPTSTDQTSSANTQTPEQLVNSFSVKEETKALINRLLNSVVVQNTGNFFYKGVHGFANGCSNGVNSIRNMVAKVTPESTLGKAGIVTVAVVTVGGIAYATYYFRDKAPVKATLGAIKGFVTSPKALAITGLAAATGAFVGSYAYETGDWKTSAYALGGVVAACLLPKAVGLAKAATSYAWNELKTGTQSVANYASNKIWGKKPVVTMILEEKQELNAKYTELLNLITSVNNTLKIDGVDETKTTILNFLNQHEKDKKFITELNTDLGLFFGQVQSLRNANKKKQRELAIEIRTNLTKTFETLKVKLNSKIS